MPHCNATAASSARFRFFSAVGLLLTSILHTTASAQCPDQASDVRIIHRFGQTFITWQEIWPPADELYRVYRSISAPDPSNLGTPVIEVPRDSAEFFVDRLKQGSPCRPFAPRFSRRLWIPSTSAAQCTLGNIEAEEVPVGRGLVVWTADPDDLGSGGQVYWTVTAVVDGIENTLLTCGNVAINPEEDHGDPLPVEVPPDCVVHPPPMKATGTESLRHIYIQYMDFRDWNTTFHAPNPFNCWWGEAPYVDSNRVSKAQQYAYSYVVTEAKLPDVDPGGPPGGSLGWPVVVRLHPRADSRWPSENMYKLAPGRAIQIHPVDPQDTWWFGFAETHDYRQGTGPVPDCADVPMPTCGDLLPTVSGAPDSGAVVNYTQFRVLRMISDLSRMADLGSFPQLVDLDRVYVLGHSMGGSGAVSFAMHFPDVFAAAAASKPMMDYREHVLADPCADFRNALVTRWGSPIGPAGGLLVGFRSVGSWGSCLPDQALSVWDWLDHPLQVVERVHCDIAPLGMVSGAADETIPYEGQGLPVYPVFAESKQAFAGRMQCTGHGDQLRIALPSALGGHVCKDTSPMFADYWVRLRETVPGFSNRLQLPAPPGAVDSPSCPGMGEGCAGPEQYFHDLEWSSSWNRWHILPVDTATEWSISLRAVAVCDCGGCSPGQPAPVTVDVTPRRTQLDVSDGDVFNWEVTDLSTGLVTTGTATAADMLVTVPGVTIPDSGVRVRVWP